MLATKIALQTTFKQGELGLWENKLNCYHFPECKQTIHTNKVKIETLSINRYKMKLKFILLIPQFHFQFIYSKEIFRGLYILITTEKEKANNIIYISRKNV